MNEENKTDDTVSTVSEEEAQKIVGDAILGKTKEETKEVADESGKETAEKEEKAEVKEEAKVEKKEETKVSEAEAELKKTLEQFKNDPQELAKAYLGMQNLQDRQGDELGRRRKDSVALEQLQERMINDPEGVKRELETLAKKKNESDNLVDASLDDPDVLPKYIDGKIKEALDGIDRKEQEERMLKESYEDYEQTAKQREQLKIAIQAGEFTPNEILHLAVIGHHSKKMLQDAGKNARAEDQEALAKKIEATVEKQGAVTSEKEGELDLTDEDTKQDIVGGAILEAKR